MNEAVKEILVKGLVRHATQAVGGGLVATGIGTESEGQVIVGVAMNALAFGWSTFRKWRRAQKAKG
jgi:hypothetical protein